MPKQHDYYDFDCGSDIKLVKFAVNSGHFHYIKVDADVANTLDFSGGIGETDTIVISGNHINHLIWPPLLGSVKNLYFLKCERLMRLDLSRFSNLEHLAIVDCPNLVKLTLPDRVRKVDLHGVNLKEVDLNHTSMIESINIASVASHLVIHASQRNFLREVWLNLRTQGHAASKGISAILSNNPSLFLVSLDARQAPVKLDVKKCHGLTELACVTSGKTSLAGSEDCIALNFLHLSSLETRLIGADKKSLDARIKKNTANKNIDPADKLAAIEKKRMAFIQTVFTYHPSSDDKETVIQQSTAGNEFVERGSVKINLLSSMMPQVREVAINDFNKARKAEQVGAYQFMRSPAFVIYYLKDSARWKHPQRMMKAARFNNDPVIAIHEWLINSDHRKPNLLLLTKPSYPAVKAFLKQYIKHPQAITWLGVKYRLKINDIVLYAGDHNALKTAVPGIANSIVTVPLATVAHNSIVLANDTFADMLIDTDMLSKHSKSLEETRVHQLDKLATDFTSAYHEMNLHMTNQQTESPGKPVQRGQMQKPITAQTPVEGAADTPPDLQGKTAPQVRMQHDPVDPAAIIDAAAESPPDMHGKVAPQFKVQHEPVDPSALIDATAESPPDMHGKVAPQVNVQHEPVDPAIMIDAAAESPPDMYGKVAPQVKVNHEPKKPGELNPQTLVEADKHAVELNVAQPLIPDEINPQIILQADSRKAEPLTPIASDEQFILQADSRKEELKSTAPLTPIETNEQLLLQTNSRKEELKSVTPLELDDVNPQQLLQANKSATEQPELRPQFFDSKAMQATNVPEVRLLDAAKKLAVALSEMVESANAQSQTIKSHELLQATSLINTANEELQRTKQIITTPEMKVSNAMTRDSLFEAARELISGLHALSDACAQMNRQPARDLKQQLNTIRQQKK